MNTEILLKILQLDSIAHLLTWEERIRVHLTMKGTGNITLNIANIYEWIEKTNWQPPEMRYGQDRLLYYEDENLQWQPIEQLEEIMKTIKIL